MKWTKPHTGSLFSLPAVMFLYCLPATADAGLLPVAAPKITCISKSHLKLSCQVNPGLLIDETLVYWLVNNSFVETAFPNGTVQMSIIESAKSIQSDLIFQSADDIRENIFTCVAMNPAGMDTHIFGGEQLRMCKNKHRRRKGIHGRNNKATLTLGELNRI